LPLQEVCNNLIRFDVALIVPEMRAYFRDVQDHVIRVVESIDNLRELLKGALEANLLLASVQQNDVTKKLAAWAAILAVPTAIAGVYGMNFKYMPELEHPEAYPIVLVAIAALCGYLYYRFKRSGWL
jgi:magnesium transporter